MKVIIAGSRDLIVTDEELKEIIVDSIGTFGEFKITEIVSGGANGIDNCGEKFAKKYKIPLKRFPADWNTHGKAAGPIRNRQMAEYADALLAIHHNSKGTQNMIAHMIKFKKPFFEVIRGE
jgi:hypothetical protein